MAVITATFRIAAGSASWTGQSATGFQGIKTVSLWDDGSITFQNAAGATRKIHDNPDLNALLVDIAQGANGIPAAKKLHT